MQYRDIILNSHSAECTRWINRSCLVSRIVAFDYFFPFSDDLSLRENRSRFPNAPLSAPREGEPKVTRTRGLEEQTRRRGPVVLIPKNGRARDMQMNSVSASRATRLREDLQLPRSRDHSAFSLRPLVPSRPRQRRPHSPRT